MVDKKSIIGNTPMIKIKYEYNGKINEIHTKLEYFNFTGSIKDRVAYYIINNATLRGKLKEGMPIVEATSGNTGISLAAFGTIYKHPVYIFMPDWASNERIKLMKSYGAKVILISREEGGFIQCVKEAEKLARKLGGLFTNQFSNTDNYLAHYETTGVEILNQIRENIGGFVSGVGTGGTLIGIGDRIKEKYPKAIIAAIEPAKMPIISQGENISQHKIEGIGDDFVPDLVKKEHIDKFILIDDEDAINMSRKLSKELGIGVGISSGANLIGSILLKEEIPDAVVTVFADDNKKYLSTDLTKDIDLNNKFISNKVKLMSFETI